MLFLELGLFKEEVVGLISELCLQGQVDRIFSTVSNEILRTDECDLTQLAGDWFRRSVVRDMSTTSLRTLDDLNSLVIELVLKIKGLLVASMKVLFPSVIDATWEHQLHLRYLS